MSSSTKSKKKVFITGGIGNQIEAVPEPAPDVPFRELLAWLEGMALVRGHGGKKEVAERLGIKPDVLSQLFKRQSGLDAKTVKLLMWMITSKAEDYSQAPIVKTVRHDGLVFELREIDGTEDWTWRPAGE
jgi:hypothetical protein